ncbi:hypothetical protein L1280_002582 [Deinococcus sp. HSC-46F16]|uniref:hypothetical protein n=1 Tax=Deinococcus sp. HSC-46F16 TaxID=2910968 RepID=UPI00209CF06C|nr:hypothetical protein [Deinococcus sp. HSC-46F16]MCP2015420.1 hypothetical protein [Deinococcus sp. HSC-46F16]
MFEAFVREVGSGQPADLVRAARRAQAAGFGVLALPGLPLGAVYALSGPALLPPLWVAVLAGLGALLAALVLRLAHSAARDPGQPPARAVLTAALQSGGAPAVPFLLGCTLLAQPPAVVALWALAGLGYAAAWNRVPGWVQAAGPRRT